MIWMWFGSNHSMAMSSWMRAWLRGPFTDRFFLLFFGPWGSGWSLFFFLIAASSSSSGMFFVALLPWGFLVVDSIIDGRHVRAELNRLMEDEHIILATRAEYVGGHPQLPHGRFVYLVIEGHRENPNITILLPLGAGDYERFPMPLLDFVDSEQRTEKTQSITGTILATLSERPSRLFLDDRVVLNVKYTDVGGRKQNVEMTSFFHGSGEVRDWRNYLICAQAEADTGVEVYGPWKSLGIGEEGSDEEELIGSGNSRNGSRSGYSGRTRAGGSAFRRR